MSFFLIHLGIPWEFRRLGFLGCVLFFSLLHSRTLAPVSMFQILNGDQITHMRRAGDILRRCLQETSAAVRPGMTTADLDRIAEEFIVSHPGATPAFKGFHGFPATICASVNDECVHGIPGSRVLNEGDIVSIDCGVIMGGMYTDACVTVPVGEVPEEVRLFLERSKAALDAAVAIIGPGTRVGDISATVQAAVEKYGYSPAKGLTGHGLGSTLHQFPDIPNVGRKGTGAALPKNVVIAVEPIVNMGGGSIKDGDDGWTITTADGSLSSHFEHTILLTDKGHEILA